MDLHRYSSNLGGVRQLFEDSVQLQTLVLAKLELRVFLYRKFVNYNLFVCIYQGYVDTESNLAFSPLGYAALLAIMAEGARGDTKEQLDNALHLPKDPQVTRIAYNTVLKRLKVSSDV